MKINLSNYWQKTTYFLICLFAFIVIGTIAFCIWSRDSEDYIIIIIAAFYVVILIIILLCSKRLCTYVIIEPCKLHAHSLFKRKLCTVDITKPTYYAEFQSPQGYFCIKQFIALSNEPFQYQATYGIAKVRFIQHYNMNRIIVLPYDKRLISLLNGIEKLYNVN